MNSTFHPHWNIFPIYETLIKLSSEKKDNEIRLEILLSIEIIENSKKVTPAGF